MTPNDTAIVLANLPPDAEITVTVKLRDWLAAKAATQGGPEYAEASEIARLVGFTAKYWVVRARLGKIAGATQDGPKGRWRLPVEACRAHVRGLQRGRKPAPVTHRPQLVRSVPRGPRQTATSQAS